MSKVTWSFKEYFYSLLSFTQALYKESQKQNAYRIVDINKNKDDEHILTVQVTGKSLPSLEYTPHEIASNNALLSGFSKKDVRTITYFATLETTLPEYRIQEQIFHDDKILFKLKKRRSKDMINKTAEEISQDKALLANLEQKDAHTIGYTLRSNQECEVEKSNLTKNII